MKEDEEIIKMVLAHFENGELKEKGIEEKMVFLTKYLDSINGGSIHQDLYDYFATGYYAAVKDMEKISEP